MSKDELRALSKNDLVRLVLKLQEQVVSLERRLAQRRKDSSTSSKPPSSDVVKPPKPAPKQRGKRRRIGGQPGHQKHERRLLPPEVLDGVFDHPLDVCPDCGAPLRRAAATPYVVQHVELVGRRFEISEHKAHWYSCLRCKVELRALVPDVVEACNLFGPRMRAFVAYLKGACHMSYSTIQTFLADVVGVQVSTGYLAKVIAKVAAALEGPYVELGDALPSQPVLNVDETGHKDRGATLWTWCFRAPGYTWYQIDPSRGSVVLKAVLGEAFGGVLGADYFSAYRKYMGDSVLVQFCMAHLIRDVRYLTTLPDKVTQNYGNRLLEVLKALFKVYHRRDKMSPERFERRMAEAKKRVLQKAKSAPPRSEAQNMAQRFRDHGESYFRFITTPGVEPTNNLAEQAIRHIVIDRRITQGTRGNMGQRWSERIWTILATCVQQGRSAFEFLAHAVEASVLGTPMPSLLPP